MRRKLFRNGARTRLRLLDAVAERFAFLDLNRKALDIASELWARARKEGRQTADDRSLDVDCVLAAQAIVAGAIVATGNVSHLGVSCDADPWESI
ncbi:MAG: hypothetical protein U0800_19840 [Isosphaeraceae bacterium]